MYSPGAGGGRKPRAEDTESVNGMSQPGAGRRSSHKPQHADRRLSTAAHMMSAGAIVLFLVSVLNASWIEQRFSYSFSPTRANRTAFLYRGLWSTTVNDGYGTTIVLRNAAVDGNGNILDPFCGEQGSTMVGPFNITDRDHNTNGWCGKKRATQGFAAASAVLAFLAVVCHPFINHDFCSELWFLAVNMAALLCAIIAASIMGGFVVAQGHTVDRTPTRDRMIPTDHQSVRVGSALIEYLVGLGMVFVASTCSVLDWERRRSKRNKQYQSLGSGTESPVFPRDTAPYHSRTPSPVFGDDTAPGAAPTMYQSI